MKFLNPQLQRTIKSLNQSYYLAVIALALTGLCSFSLGLTIPAHTNDGMVRQHQTAGLDIINQAGSNMRTGRFDPDNGSPADSDSLNAVIIFPFLLPDHGANPAPFSNANFTINLNTIDNSPDYNIDLYGVNARVASDPMTEDYHFTLGIDTATNVEKLQDDFITSSSLVGNIISTNISAWLNTQYASGANIGKYVFLRLTPVAAGSYLDITNGYMISSANDITAENQPQINYTLDTSEILNRNVTITYGPNGSGSPSGTVQVINGGTLDIDLNADDFFHTDQVLVNGNSVSFSSTVTTPAITSDMTVDVTFAPNHNFWNIPDWWLAQYNPNWTENLPASDISLILESSSLDQDGDGRPTWQEYQAGTDPTDANSFFSLDIGKPSGLLELGIDTVAVDQRTVDFERRYTLEYGNDLESWTAVTGMSDLPGTDSRITYKPNVAANEKEFFRAKVELVETGTNADRPPNIIMILTDDQGWGDLAFKGHPYLKTPHLDRLAQEGTVFDNFYVGNPTCSPARAGFMTGRFPAELQIHTALKTTTTANNNDEQVDFLPHTLPNVASVLQANGYATAHYGKWHLGQTPNSPTISSYGFDHSLTGNHPPGSPALPSSKYWDQYDEPAYSAGYANTYNRNLSTHAMVYETVKFIEENRHEPFYVNIWANLPHTILKPTPDQLAEYAGLSASSSDFSGIGPGYSFYLNNADGLDSQMQVYCASITPIDNALGVLLDKLEELGLAGNTIIMFTSDNGPEDYDVSGASNAGVGSPGPFRARKRSLFEGGIRVPCIVRWPEKVAMGKVDTESIWSAADWFPTVLSLAGVPMPAGTDLSGEDVSGMILGTSTTRTKPIIWEYRNGVFHHSSYGSNGGQLEGWDPPRFAIREGDYKLLTEENGTGTLLYNLRADPREDNDISGDPSQSARIADLKAKIMSWKATLPGPR